MTRIVSFFFLYLCLVSCNKTEESSLACVDCGIPDSGSVVLESPALALEGSPAAAPGVVTDPPLAPVPEAQVPSPAVDALPNEALTFDTNVKFYKVTPAQEAKFLKAIEIIKEVVGTEEFRTKVLNFTYKGKKTYVDNGGLTNDQIYQKILEGAEKLQNTKDNQMDLEIELYTAFNSTVGYTYPSANRIWVNSKFFNSYTAAGVARNLFHEWLHKLGFTHASRYAVSRDSSVPYAIGDMVGELGKDFL